MQTRQTRYVFQLHVRNRLSHHTLICVAQMPRWWRAECAKWRGAPLPDSFNSWDKRTILNLMLTLDTGQGTCFSVNWWESLNWHHSSYRWIIKVIRRYSFNIEIETSVGLNYIFKHGIELNRKLKIELNWIKIKNWIELDWIKNYTLIWIDN